MLRDDDAAADVVQDTFEYFFRKIPVFRFEAKTETLLFKAARNRCLNVLDKARRRGTSCVEDASEVAGDAREDPAAKAQDADLARTAVTALDSLSREHREVIVLKIMKGLTYEDIGSVLEVPSGTVKSRLHSALEVLRKKLDSGRTKAPDTGL
jgi:RNA polymerase sigma-70 factor (ECF subfamily)